MAVTRRSIWMDDAQWTTLGDKAQSAGMSVSQLIRFALLDDDSAEVEAQRFTAQRSRDLAALDTRKRADRPEPQPMTQTQRDAILKRVNKGN